MGVDMSLKPLAQMQDEYEMPWLRNPDPSMYHDISRYMTMDLEIIRKNVIPEYQKIPKVCIGKRNAISSHQKV
jgi:hypothetical protein